MVKSTDKQQLFDKTQNGKLKIETNKEAYVFIYAVKPVLRGHL
jgi:hypothetical protein